MLERIPNRPPKIEPLLDNLNRPLWSVMIPSYNCIHYLREAINSVLIQALTVEEMFIYCMAMIPLILVFIKKFLVYLKSIQL